MSQIPQCIQCGGTEYILESGFYFCAECHIQSQDVQEQVFEEYYGGQRATSQKVTGPGSQEEKASNPTCGGLSSFEVLNLMLRGLVDEVILLGADKRIKVIVLQLWAKYLMKNEIAFVSTRVEVKPRLGVAFKTSDAEVLYGAQKQSASLCKQPIYRIRRKRVQSSTGTSSETSSTLTARSKKIRFTLKKKALAKAEYESVSELNQTQTGSIGKSSQSDTSSKKSYKLRFTKVAEEKLTKLLAKALMAKSKEDRRALQKKLYASESRSPRHAGMLELVSLLRLGLLILDSPVHLSDIFRWNSEGYLSVRQGEKLVGKGTTVGKDISYMMNKTISSWDKVQRSTSKLAHILGVSNISVNMKKLCEKFISELGLPSSLMQVINKMMAFKRPTPKLSERTNYEGKAIAYIIVALKLLFSLDDSTEYQLSDVATQINKQKGKEEVFCWEGWQCWSEKRLAVASLYSQFIRDKHYPDSRFGGAEAFLAQWDYSPRSQHLPRTEDIDQGLVSSMRGIFSDLARDAREPIGPSLEPMHHTTHILRERGDFSRFPDFTTTEISPFASPNEMWERVSECGLKTKVLRGRETEAVRVKRGAGMREMRRREARMTETMDIKITDKRRKCKHDPLLPRTYNSRRKASVGIIKADLYTRLDSSSDNSVYIPFYEYWLYHGVFTTMSLYEFDKLSKTLLPNTFIWLLNLCSALVDQNARDIYLQVMLVEKVYLEILSPSSKRQNRHSYALVDNW